MHELIEYACNELDTLEKKAKKGSMSMTELEYANKLAELKKNLLKGKMLYEEVMDGGEYSEDMIGGRGGMYAGRSGSYARNGRNSYERRRSGGGNDRRYSRDGGGYSRSSEDLVDQLRRLMEDAPDEQTRREIEKLVRKMETM